MIGLFKWAERLAPPQHSDLGGAVVLRRADTGSVVPPDCVGLACSGASAQRVEAGKRVDGETAYIFHPGPYRFEIVPYEDAPELGLHLQLAVDEPDPRMRQQRFDLFVLAEAGDGLTVEALRALAEASVQRELAQGGLFLPPCTSIEEWHAFRAGVNQLVYTRFGFTVEDCYPVDLAGQVDFAAQLRARAVAGEAVAASRQPPVTEPSGAAAPEQPAWPERTARMLAALRGKPAVDAAEVDAHALRRLFLELPNVICTLRTADVSDCADFHARQALLARLDAASLAVTTMPSLEWEAPGRRLAGAEQVRRAQAGAEALEALDEMWALLARVAGGGEGACAQAADAADRVVSNLECALAARRAVRLEAA
jgi:hypothetical protein